MTLNKWPISRIAQWDEWFDWTGDEDSIQMWKLAKSRPHSRESIENQAVKIEMKRLEGLRIEQQAIKTEMERIDLSKS